ncbi:MAG TPA: PAS domain S-box protein [Thermoanaerobaculia bacterium]|nr:PAS domain S-box protein [Thermoanaerobaculia bacterium]
MPITEDERRSRLLDALPAIAWSASAETFRFTYVNPAAETLLGYPVSRWLDEPTFWSEHLHPEDRHVPMLCHNETLAGRNHELVYRMIAADGRTVWLRDYVNVHRVNGVPVELFGVMVDITREREAEAESIENRENFRRMVEWSPDCIGVHVGNSYVYVNQSFVQLLGANSEAEIVGQSLFSFIDPAFHDGVHNRLERLKAGARVPYERMKYRRADGSLLDVEVAALPLRYGNRDAVQVIARDITDRLRAEEELRVREARLHLLASGTHEAIWEWSSERDELWTNDAYRQMFGDSNAGTFMDEWLSRVHPDDRENAWGVGNAVENGQRTWGHEYRLRQEDGTYRVVLDRGHTVKLASGERRVIGALLDVTPMREAERTAARKLEEAKRLASLGQVAASLAHEFNNVLMGIQPFVEWISREVPPTRSLSDAIGHITRAISRGKRASQEILRFANPKEPQLSPIDARTWLPTLLGQLVPVLPPTIALSHSMEPAVRSIRGDAQHLEQVITNLVYNARDAISGGGTIHVDVALSEDAERVRISVRDNGPGIKPELVDQIFEPLFTTKRNGTGLGLAIARRLIERQGGSMTAENRPEGGAAFHLIVPVAEAPSPALQTPSLATPDVKSILIVEDDLTVGRGLEILLQSSGFETLWVQSAEEALVAAQQTRLHVAVIDVNLPDGNGVDLIPQLRAEHHDLPIVLSTGHVELDFASDKNRTISLMKPYEFGDLLAAIGSVSAAA